MTVRAVGATPEIPEIPQTAEQAPGPSPGPALEVPLGPPSPVPVAAAPAVLALPRVPRFRGPAWPQDPGAPALQARIAAAEADPALHQEVAAEALAAAQARLHANGVGFAPATLEGGFEGLRILPDARSALGALADFLHEQADGFALLYSPAKLLQDRTRGAVWGYHREVAAAHDMIFEGRPDPITLHEVEHAVLNVGEEQGRAHPWLGFMQSLDGSPLSEVDAEQGGYTTYCSFQEIPAYAGQVRVLGRRLLEVPEPGKDLDELEAMARWGRALAGRAADVARRGLEQLAAHPDTAVFERRQLAPAGREPADTPSRLWVSLDRPETRVSVPLFEAEALPSFEAMMAAHGGAPEAWDASRAVLLGLLRRRLEDIVGRADEARGRFSALETRAGALREAGAPPKMALEALAREAIKL